MLNALTYPLLTLAMWAWCVVYFWMFQKPAFRLANRGKCPASPAPSDIRKIYLKGGVSDCIVASYLTAFPILAGYVCTFFPSLDIRWVFIPYAAAASLAVALICIGDAGLYAFWQSKIDASVFAYLRHPKGAFASVSGSYMLGAFLCVALAAAVFFAGWYAAVEIIRTIRAGKLPFVWNTSVCTVCLILLLAAGAVIIRGLKIRPNNPSVVYFSPVAFFNHWALNPIYNMIYSLGTRNEFRGKFQSFGEEERKALFNPLFPTEGTPGEKLLKTDRPDILIVVWESFGARFCGALGGKQGVTPCFDALCKEGVLFSRCRAASFRTDRALPAIFCGLPAQPTTSIIRYTRKIANLPAFPAELRDLGYATTAVHGGDLTIMHKSDFYLSAGHSRLMSEKDFQGGLDKGKWGVHDGPVLERVAEDILRMPEEHSPWLITVQTLSSHEPFKVPFSRLADEEDNSMAYTDAALGALADTLRKSPVWDNLLMIVVADHGLNNGDPSVTRDDYSHIPLLWTGGAVKEPRVIDSVMNQSDLPATLLGQLGLPHRKFPFSRDVLADTYTIPSSFHTYVNGFYFSDASGATDYDTLAGKAAEGTGDTQREKRGLAILQTLFEYLDKL